MPEGRLEEDDGQFLCWNPLGDCWSPLPGCWNPLEDCWNPLDGCWSPLDCCWPTLLDEEGLELGCVTESHGTEDDDCLTPWELTQPGW